MDFDPPSKPPVPWKAKKIYPVPKLGTASIRRVSNDGMPGSGTFTVHADRRGNARPMNEPRRGSFNEISQGSRAQAMENLTKPGFGVRPAVFTSVDSLYQKTAMVGEGTYGKVYKATHRITNSTVALKKVRIETEKEGFPITGIREIKILTSLRHKNVVQLLDIISDESKGQSFVNLVFEYMDHDLTGVFNNPNLKWEPQHIKCIMTQLFEGLSYMHGKGMVHRDMKGSNLLLNKDGILKLADFGLARMLSVPKIDYTNRVITLWYRPPELLLGSTTYGTEIDMWSSGCIMAEMLLKRPIFPGNDEISQLDNIWRVCGTPTEELWPGVEAMPWWGMMRPKQSFPRSLRDLMKRHIIGDGFKLLDSLLQLDPGRRPSASECLEHPYFSADLPRACLPSELPKVEGDWHEYESKQRKRGRPVESDEVFPAVEPPQPPPSYQNERDDMWQPNSPVQYPPPPNQMRAEKLGFYKAFETDQAQNDQNSFDSHKQKPVTNFDKRGTDHGFHVEQSSSNRFRNESNSVGRDASRQAISTSPDHVRNRAPGQLLDLDRVGLELVLGALCEQESRGATVDHGLCHHQVQGPTIHLQDRDHVRVRDLGHVLGPEYQKRDIDPGAGKEDRSRPSENAREIKDRPRLETLKGKDTFKAALDQKAREYERGEKRERSKPTEDLRLDRRLPLAEQLEPTSRNFDNPFVHPDRQFRLEPQSSSADQEAESRKVHTDIPPSQPKIPPGNSLSPGRDNQKTQSFVPAHLSEMSISKSPAKLSGKELSPRIEEELSEEELEGGDAPIVATATGLFAGPEVNAVIAEATVAVGSVEKAMPEPTQTIFSSGEAVGSVKAFSEPVETESLVDGDATSPTKSSSLTKAKVIAKVPKKRGRSKQIHEEPVDAPIIDDTAQDHKQEPESDLQANPEIVMKSQSPETQHQTTPKKAGRGRKPASAKIEEPGSFAAVSVPTFKESRLICEIPDLDTRVVGEAGFRRSGRIATKATLSETPTKPDLEEKPRAKRKRSSYNSSQTLDLGPEVESEREPEPVVDEPQGKVNSRLEESKKSPVKISSENTVPTPVPDSASAPPASAPTPIPTPAPEVTVAMEVDEREESQGNDPLEEDYLLPKTHDDTTRAGQRPLTPNYTAFFQAATPDRRLLVDHVNYTRLPSLG
ncbi:kinase subunit of RNA polymerase II carboxy-terminal domain kinase I [Phlyctochytrium planicorne]|nr:kinase subunit of RNA polymerase II carboxy-terminal domain kinase I [Phlyctochytrium planicorne]